MSKTGVQDLYLDELVEKHGDEFEADIDEEIERIEHTFEAAAFYLAELRAFKRGEITAAELIQHMEEWAQENETGAL